MGITKIKNNKLYMNDIVKDLELIPIESVSLSESEVGRNINDRFNNIDRNFQSIIDSEYLKGQTGDGIYTKECSFEKDSSEGLGIYKSNQSLELTSGELYELISECILTGVEYQDPLTVGRIPGGRIVLIYQNNDGKNILKSSLPYVFIDEVYLSSLKEENKPNPNEDLSCILYFENNDFVKSSTIPKIYYDDEAATYCWNINGVRTQLPAQGPRGIDGNPGTSVYYAKCKYMNNQYILTHVYEQGSFNANATLENGTVVMAYVTNNNPTTIIIGVVNKDASNNDTNIIAESVELNIPSISVLMKNNDSHSLYVTIPSTNESTNELYHKISSSTISDVYVLKMGVVEETDTESESIEGGSLLKSEYSRNEFAGDVDISGEVIITGKLTANRADNNVCASSLSTSPTVSADGNNIKINVGGQTSDAFTVPFATKATELTGQPSIQKDGDKNIKINVGGQTSDAFTVPFANYSGYALNPILIEYNGITIEQHNINVQQNKINYIYAINKSSGSNLPTVTISLPQPDESSYVNVPTNDDPIGANNQIGICQFVLYIDASISMNIKWTEPHGNNSQLTSVYYNIDSDLLETQLYGVKELIFTGYWKKIKNNNNIEKHVTWLVGGSTSQLTNGMLNPPV